MVEFKLLSIRTFSIYFRTLTTIVNNKNNLFLRVKFTGLPSDDKPELPDLF
jgi:hypothetical protein